MLGGRLLVRRAASSGASRLGWSTEVVRRSNGTKAKAVAPLDVAAFPPALIRNFCIIAHIDAGKSTLADRVLELGGLLSKDSKNEQFLDNLSVERERGITVKARTVTLTHKYKGVEYLLNLIDTPGHVDFSYEVSRSLAACQSAILLVDGTRGIQAQTLANFYLAIGVNAVVIPAINKIDVQMADIPAVIREVESSLDFKADEIQMISAKTGLGVSELLDTLIVKGDTPRGSPTSPVRLRLFDSWFDEYKGVVCLVEVFDGQLSVGDLLKSHASGREYTVMEVGTLRPDPVPTPRLFTGQVGYVVTGMKAAGEARVGDTLSLVGASVEPFPGFAPARPVVFAGVYPKDASTVDDLRSSIEKLLLTDASVSCEKETSVALGMGFRCGFLGLLHMDVFKQRLRDEYGAEIIVTAPTVPYHVRLREDPKSVVVVDNPSKFPPPEKVHEYEEPMVNATIILPAEHFGPVMKLCLSRRAVLSHQSPLGDNRTVLTFRIPLCEVITDFNDRLKSVTAGYASLDLEEAPYQKSDLVLLSVLLNGEKVDALSSVVYSGNAESVGRRLVDQLKDIIPRQSVLIKIQASANNKIVARSTVAPFRRDVTAGMSGGDITRKMKLLEKQKKGRKKRAGEVGSIHIGPEVYAAVLHTTHS